MRYSKLIAAATLAAPALALAQQVPAQVVITFDALNVAVPVGAWLPAISAALIVGAAVVWRKRMGVAVRSLAVVAAAALAAGSFVQVRDAQAVSLPFAIALLSSPSQTPITQNIGIATNATGRALRITSVSIIQAGAQSSQSCPLSIVPASTTCNPGTELGANATCQVAVTCPAS